MKERQSPSSGESERETRAGRSETERHRLRDRRHEVESERQGPSKRRGKRDFPGGLVAMTLRSQYKGHRFDPWWGN